MKDALAIPDYCRGLGRTEGWVFQGRGWTLLGVDGEWDMVLESGSYATSRGGLDPSRYIGVTLALPQGRGKVVA